MVAFVSLLKILFPFLKEWFFDKKTFKNWFRKNFGVIIMTILVLLMFYAFQKMLTHVIYVKQQYHTLAESNARLVRQNKWLVKRTDDQNKRIVALTEQNAASQVKILKYEHWMAACGMNYLQEEITMPVCTNERRSSTPARRPAQSSSNRNTGRSTRPGINKPRTTTPSTTNPKQTQNHIRELWGGH